MTTKNKDFSSSAQRVKTYISEAVTAAEEPTRKARKTYSEEEAAAFLEEGHTSGRKGVKLPRINVAFKPSVYEYISTMARVRGETMTDFINLVLEKHMDDNQEIYKKALEFRKSL